jgi:hypothetical protein
LCQTCPYCFDQWNKCRWGIFPLDVVRIKKFFSEMLMHYGRRVFPGCKMHSGNPSPSATLGEEGPGKSSTGKPPSPRAGNRTLGEGFTERRGRTRGREFVFFKKNPKIGTMSPARHCGPLRPSARLCAIAIAAVGRHRPPLRRLRGRRRSLSRLADAVASWPRTSRRARRRAEVAAAPGVGARRRPHREGVQAAVGRAWRRPPLRPG